MTKCFIYSISLTLILLTACKTSKTISKTKETRPENITLLAWNEDTLHSYLFALTHESRFAYKISNHDSIKADKSYYGSFVYSSFSDTIFLTYDNNIQPAKATNYLIRVVGGYLVQPFVNSQKRVF